MGHWWVFGRIQPASSFQSGPWQNTDLKYLFLRTFALLSKFSNILFFFIALVSCYIFQIKS